MLSPETIPESFYVVLHDVTPRFRKEIEVIVRATEPLIGRQMAAAVVPRWNGQDQSHVDREFAADIDRDFGEILLHGFTHRRIAGAGSISRLTGGCDEFNGYSHSEAHARVDQGQLEMERVFGRRPSGFIAPTFQMGQLDIGRFPEHGLFYKIGFYAIETFEGQQVPLATWCWDMGHIRFLGVLGDVYGTARHRLRRNALPCLALHPVDVTRGFLDRIVDRIRTLMAEGRRPILMEPYAGQLTASTR